MRIKFVKLFSRLSRLAGHLVVPVQKVSQGPRASISATQLSSISLRFMCSVLQVTPVSGDTGGTRIAPYGAPLTGPSVRKQPRADSLTFRAYDLLEYDCQQATFMK